MRRLIPFLAILGMFTIAVANLYAATRSVSEATGAALRNAVANAGSGDVITFDPALFTNGPVEILLTDTILVEKDLTITGPENASLTLNGNSHPIFSVGVSPQGCHVLLRNMKLFNGLAQGKNGEAQCTGGGGGAGLGGAVYVNFAILTCQNVVFEKNSAIGGDGGISGMSNAVNGGKGGDACSPYLIYRTDSAEHVRGNNLGGLGGNVNSIVHMGSPGGYACGGGGGIGEIIGANAAVGGKGGWAGGGGGGGGGLFTHADGGIGGEFGGDGGWGELFASHGGGGGGAGLGGAIFVDSNGGLILENCVFRGNQAIGGAAGSRGKNGQGKGGAIFTKPNTLLNLYNVTFAENMATDARGYSYTYGVYSDTYDIYRTGTLSRSAMAKHLVVTTAQDEDNGFYYGAGISLREALQFIEDGGQIDISGSILPATLTINSTSGQLIIEKNVKIKAPDNKPFVIDGNQKRVFFVKSGHLYLENLKIVNAKAKGGNGGLGGWGGGGAAGMGGAVFINKNAILSAKNVQFENCSAQGGNGGGTIEGTLSCGGGGGIGGDGSPGEQLNRSGGSGWPLSDYIAVYNLSHMNLANGTDGGGGAGSPSCTAGGNGGFGGGGGAGEKIGYGRGGYGGGSGGGNMEIIPGFPKVLNPGGKFGGAALRSGGGGGGLGGALFVREQGSLFLDRCEFNNNTARAGEAGIAHNGAISYPGQGKGGAIFTMENAIAKVRNCSFIANTATDFLEGVGFTYSLFSDTPDVYGVLNDLTDSNLGAFPPTEITPTPTPIGEEIPTPTVTPTPYATPTPDIQPTPVPMPASIRYEFSGKIAEENKVTLQGAGFGAYPQTDVSFGYLPTDNAFEGATDGQGIIVIADPGEGVMIFGERVDTNYAALIRCSVRTDRPHADVTIASIGSDPGRFIAVNYPEDDSYFNGRYMRLQTFCVPPSTGFQPLVQVVNTSETETLTAYIDNLDVYFIDPYKYYSGAFLDGDEVDPPAEMIAIPLQSESMGLDTSITITASPHPNSNTKIDVSWNSSAYGWYDFIALQITTDSTLQKWEDMYRMFGSIAAYNYTIDGLEPDTVYYVRLVIVNLWSRRDSSAVMVRTNP